MINFFLQSKDFGGAEKFANDLLLEMAKNNKSVFLYSSNDYLLNNLNKQKNVNLNKIPIYLDFASNHRGLIKSLLLCPLALIYYLKILRQIKNRPTKQYIVCSGFSEKILISPLAKFFNLDLFFIEYGPLEPIFSKLYGIPKILYYLVKNFAKKIIVSSHNTKQALNHIFNQEKIVLIPCGSPIIEPNKQIATVKKNSLIVVSRLENGKGQDLAIKAFGLIKKELKDSQLWIVGKGNFYQELKLLAKNEQGIKFLKYVANTTNLIAQSNLVICPSVWSLEGFGLIVIEAMALEKPIVAFNRAPYNEILKNEQNALLAEDHDYHDLADKIIKLLQNQKLQKKLAKQAKKDFMKKYQIKKIAHQYLTLLQN